MLGDCDLMAFVATADIGAARAFYLNTLGLRLIDESPFALLFDAHGTSLRVVPVGEPLIAPYTVLGWRVDNLEQTLRHLAESGVPASRFEGMAQDEAGIWTTPRGDRIAWFQDPDGNTLSVTEYARDR